MAKCDRCYELFAPNFMLDIEGTDGRECVFCNTGETEIKLKNNKVYTRSECIKDYKIFLKMLKESKKVKDIIDKRW